MFVMTPLLLIIQIVCRTIIRDSEVYLWSLGLLLSVPFSGLRTRILFIRCPLRYSLALVGGEQHSLLKHYAQYCKPSDPIGDDTFLSMGHRPTPLHRILK